MAHKKTAVIGDPIDHSLSPKIHNHWIESEKIDVGPYQKINVKKENFIRDVGRLIEEGYYGLNVRVPLKEEAYKYCDYTSDVARTLKAVNTLVVNKDGIYGDNTDPIGFEKSIANGKCGPYKYLLLATFTYPGIPTDTFEMLLMFF